MARADPAGYLGELEHFIAALVAPPDGVALVALVQFPQQGPADALTDAGAREQNWIMQTELADDWDRAARLAVAAFPGHAVYLTTAAALRPGWAVPDLDAHARRGPGSGPASSTTPTCAPTEPPSSGPW